MKKVYVVGISRDGRGVIVHWTQMAKDIEQAKEIVAEWELTGIININILSL